MNSLICDIIQNNYYQRVVESEIAFFSGQIFKAYNELTTLDQECELGNSILYHELYYYALMSIQLHKAETAFNSIKRLIRNYGYHLSDFETIKNYPKLKKERQWKQFKRECCLLEEQFVSDTTVFLFFMSMGQRDQELRLQYLDSCRYYQRDSIKISSIKMKYNALIDSLDETNGDSLLYFFEGNRVRNFRLSNDHRQSIYFSLLSVVIHCANQPKIYDSLLPILWEAIQQRRLPPELYAALVDRRQLNMAQKYIYGFYDNLSPEQIVDFKNLDERRRTIGLPSYSEEKNLKIKQREYYQTLK